MSETAVANPARQRSADSGAVYRTRVDDRPDGGVDSWAYGGDAGFRSGGWSAALQECAGRRAERRRVKTLLKIVAFLPVYIALVVTVTLLLVWAQR